MESIKKYSKSTSEINMELFQKSVPIPTKISCMKKPLKILKYNNINNGNNIKKELYWILYKLKRKPLYLTKKTKNNNFTL